MKNDKTQEWMRLMLTVNVGTLFAIVGFTNEDAVFFWLGAFALMGACMYMFLNSFERKG